MILRRRHRRSSWFPLLAAACVAAFGVATGNWLSPLSIVPGVWAAQWLFGRTVAVGWRTGALLGGVLGCFGFGIVTDLKLEVAIAGCAVGIVLGAWLGYVAGLLNVLAGEAARSVRLQRLQHRRGNLEHYYGPRPLLVPPPMQFSLAKLLGLVTLTAVLCAVARWSVPWALFMSGPASAAIFTRFFSSGSLRSECLAASLGCIVAWIIATLTLGLLESMDFEKIVAVFLLDLICVVPLGVVVGYLVGGTTYVFATSKPHGWWLSPLGELDVRDD